MLKRNFDNFNHSLLRTCINCTRRCRKEICILKHCLLYWVFVSYQVTRCIKCQHQPRAVIWFVYLFQFHFNSCTFGTFEGKPFWGHYDSDHCWLMFILYLIKFSKIWVYHVNSKCFGGGHAHGYVQQSNNIMKGQMSLGHLAYLWKFGCYIHQVI